MTFACNNGGVLHAEVCRQFSCQSEDSQHMEPWRQTSNLDSALFLAACVPYVNGLACHFAICFYVFWFPTQHMFAVHTFYQISDLMHLLLAHQPRAVRRKTNNSINLSWRLCKDALLQASLQLREAEVRLREQNLEMRERAVKMQED